METELSDSSSSIGNDMDWSFDTMLDLFDNDNSTIAAVLKLVLDYGTMIYGEAS
jgi:hypothetical protein